MSFFNELRRRNVLRVAAAYVVAAWLLIQVAETIFPLFGFGDAPARIAVILLAIGLPLFLVFSWVFELTPEGLKLERDVRREESISPRTGKQLDRVIIALLALALGYFAVDKFVFEPARVAALVEETARQARTDALVGSFGDQSIAVLPFVDLSPEGDQEYFSDGISEELLNLLSKVPALRVIARTSSFFYKNKDVQVADVGRELNVAHVLEGSVRKAGNRVRVTAQLIEARSETHLWSGTFEQELGNILAVQDEIAAQVVAQLKMKLLDERPAAQQPDAEAYDLYLRARFNAQARTPEALEKSIGQIREALDLDPAFAEARAYLATLFFLKRAYGRLATAQEREAMFELAEATARQALGQNENLPVPYAILAVRAMYARQWRAAEENFRRAMELGPNDSQVLRWYSRQLMWLGYLAEARDLARAAHRLDPINASSNANLGLAHALLGEDEEARKYAGIGRELGLAYFYSPDIIVHLANGRLQEAADAWSAGLEASGNSAEMVAMVFEAAANPELVAPTLRFIEAMGPQAGPAREHDLALLFLRQYAEYLGQVGGDTFMTLWTELARPARQLRAFRDVATDNRMVEFWKARGWPDLCREADGGFTCD